MEIRGSPKNREHKAGIGMKKEDKAKRVLNDMEWARSHTPREIAERHGVSIGFVYQLAEKGLRFRRKKQGINNEAVLELHRETLESGLKETAERHGMTYGRLAQWLHKLGLKTRKRNEMDMMGLAERVNSSSLECVSREMGISKQCLCMKLRNAGFRKMYVLRKH